MKLFHLTGMGVLRRARADRPKMEVFLSNNLAADLLADVEFITDSDSRNALLHAGREVFTSFGEGNRFSEPCRTPTGHSTGSVALVCLQAHLAVFTIKVREHLKLRQRVTGTGPRSNFNTGHRQTWEAELEVLDGHLMSQGARQRNSLRLIDGHKDYRELSVCPPSISEPLVPLSIASALEAFGAADSVWNAYAVSRPYVAGPISPLESPGGGVVAPTSGVAGVDAGATGPVVGSGSGARTNSTAPAGSTAAGDSTRAGGSAGAAAGTTAWGSRVVGSSAVAAGSMAAGSAAAAGSTVPAAASAAAAGPAAAGESAAAGVSYDIRT